VKLRPNNGILSRYQPGSPGLRKMEAEGRRGMQEQVSAEKAKNGRLWGRYARRCAGLCSFLLVVFFFFSANSILPDKEGNAAFRSSPRKLELEEGNAAFRSSPRQLELEEGNAAFRSSPRQLELEEGTKVRILDKIIDLDTNHGVSEAGMRLAELYEKPAPKFISFRHVCPANLEVVYLKYHKVGGTTLGAVLERDGTKGNFKAYVSDSGKVTFNEDFDERQAIVDKLGFSWNGEPGLPVIEKSEQWKGRFASFGHHTLPLAGHAARSARNHPELPDTYRQTLEQTWRTSTFMHTRSGAAPLRFFIVTMLREPVSRYQSWFYYSTRGFAPSIHQFYTIEEVIDLRARLLSQFGVSKSLELEKRMEIARQKNTPFFQDLSAEFREHVREEATRRDLPLSLKEMKLSEVRLIERFNDYMTLYDHIDAIDFVGITEHFDESMALLCKMLSMPALSCSYAKVGRDTRSEAGVKPKVPMLEGTREKVALLVSADTVLYDAAVKRHNALVANWLGTGDLLEEAVAALHEAGASLAGICAEFQCI
jgi:hypothetical protein